MRGNLVLFSCGHRGTPNRSEEKRVSRLMRRSGFIPMLEVVYGDENLQKGAKIEYERGDTHYPDNQNINRNNSQDSKISVSKFETGEIPAYTAHFTSEGTKTFRSEECLK